MLMYTNISGCLIMCEYAYHVYSHIYTLNLQVPTVYYAMSLMYKLVELYYELVYTSNITACAHIAYGCDVWQPSISRVSF